MDKLLTIDDVCAITGLRRSTIYKMICEKRIPFLKISGRCVRFWEADIERWLKSKTIDVKAPEAQEALKPPRKGGRRKKKPRNAFMDTIVEAAKREVLS